MLMEAVSTSAEPRDILEALHNGPLETPLWNSFLKELRSRINAEFCGLFFRQGDAHITDSTVFWATSTVLEDLLPAYKQGFHEYDPVPWDDLVPGRVYSIREFMREGDPRHEAYMRDFLIPGRRQFMHVMRVLAPDGYNACLTIWRSDQEFRPEECAYVATLAAHLRTSLALYSVIERERVRAGISGEAVRQLNFAWLRLDGRGRVLDMDAQAQELVRNSPAVRILADNRLALATPEANRRLAEALRDFSADSALKPRALRLSDDPWLDMLLRPVRDHVLSGPARPVLTAYIHGDRGSSAARVELFVQLFGLSPSEARLALALSRGRTIAEAAAEQGITEQTARGYSKIVYAKTGARGQADLVRILLASAASLA